jgi:hypothetical protein
MRGVAREPDEMCVIPDDLPTIQAREIQHVLPSVLPGSAEGLGWPPWQAAIDFITDSPVGGPYVVAIRPGVCPTHA